MVCNTDNDREIAWDEDKLHFPRVSERQTIHLPDWTTETHR